MIKRIEMTESEYTALLDRDATLRAQLFELARAPQSDVFVQAALDELREYGMPHPAFEPHFERLCAAARGEIDLDASTALQKQAHDAHRDLRALSDGMEAADERYADSLALLVHTVYLHHVVSLHDAREGKPQPSRSVTEALAHSVVLGLVRHFGVVVVNGDPIPRMLSAAALDRLALMIDAIEASLARASYTGLAASVGRFVDRVGHPGGDAPLPEGEENGRCSTVRALLRLAAERATDAPALVAALRRTARLDGRFDDALLSEGFYAPDDHPWFLALLPEGSPRRRTAVSSAVRDVYQLVRALSTPLYVGETEIVERLARCADRAFAALAEIDPDRPMPAAERAQLRAQIATRFDGV